VAPAAEGPKQAAASGPGGAGKKSAPKEASLDQMMDGFLRRIAKRSKSSKTVKRRIMVLVYWPAGEWPAMLERWPRFADEYGGDHATHRKMLEDMFVLHSEDPDLQLAAAPLTVQGLLDFAAENGLEAAASETRAKYAGAIGQAKQATAWPPPKLRARCWCGSGKPYELCCYQPD
jgi:hypothetical protein